MPAAMPFGLGIGRGSRFQSFDEGMFADMDFQELPLQPVTRTNYEEWFSESPATVSQPAVYAALPQLDLGAVTGAQPYGDMFTAKETFSSRTSCASSISLGNGSPGWWSAKDGANGASARQDSATPAFGGMSVLDHILGSDSFTAYVRGACVDEHAAQVSRAPGPAHFAETSQYLHLLMSEGSISTVQYTDLATSLTLTAASYVDQVCQSGAVLGPIAKETLMRATAKELLTSNDSVLAALEVIRARQHGAQHLQLPVHLEQGSFGVDTDSLAASLMDNILSSSYDEIDELQRARAGRGKGNRFAAALRKKLGCMGRSSSPFHPGYSSLDANVRAAAGAREGGLKRLAKGLSKRFCCCP